MRPVGCFIDGVILFWLARTSRSRVCCRLILALLGSCNLVEFFTSETLDPQPLLGFLLPFKWCTLSFFSCKPDLVLNPSYSSAGDSIFAEPAYSTSLFYTFTANLSCVRALWYGVSSKAESASDIMEFLSSTASSFFLCFELFLTSSAFSSIG